MVYTQPRKSFRMWGLQDLVGFLYADCKILEHNQLDITVIDKESKKCLLINPAWQFDSQIEKKKKKNAQIIVSWSMKLKKLENEKGRSYTGNYNGIRNSNKTLWEMDR